MGRLYGRERFQPGAILGQIALLQALFYAAFSAATFVGCTVVGVAWPVSLVVTDEYYTGAWWWVARGGACWTLRQRYDTGAALAVEWVGLRGWVGGAGGVSWCCSTAQPG